MENIKEYTARKKAELKKYIVFENIMIKDITRQLEEHYLPPEAKDYDK